MSEMKNVVLIILLVVATTTAIANNADPATNLVLSGQVVDETGEPLAGVEVVIEGLNKKVYTDFDGNFEIAQLRNGAYTLVINYVSYKQEKTVLKTELNNNSKVLIKLQHKEMKVR